MIYRGFDIEERDGKFYWTDAAGNEHEHDTDEQAMDAIDKYKRSTIG